MLKSVCKSSALQITKSVIDLISNYSSFNAKKILKVIQKLISIIVLDERDPLPENFLQEKGLIKKINGANPLKVSD